jgi:uncharacterized protein (DUF2141 family)
MKTGFGSKCLLRSARLFLVAFALMNGLNFMPVDSVSPDQRTLIVVISNIKNERGYIHVALYNNKEIFLKKHWRGETVNAAKGHVKVTFTDLPEGEYAIGIIHDENKNEKLDKNLLGIPIEGYGFSNNASGFLGSPKFEQASFHFPTRKEISISMKYF